MATIIFKTKTATFEVPNQGQSLRHDINVDFTRRTKEAVDKAIEEYRRDNGYTLKSVGDLQYSPMEDTGQYPEE
tara:strand:- start:523 stop:744 length:222 start_codon:yes stop_codon:yes gene_type:complete